MIVLFVVVCWLFYCMLVCVFVLLVCAMCVFG